MVPLQARRQGGVRPLHQHRHRRHPPLYRDDELRRQGDGDQPVRQPPRAHLGQRDVRHLPEDVELLLAAVICHRRRIIFVKKTCSAMWRGLTIGPHVRTRASKQVSQMGVPLPSFPKQMPLLPTGMIPV